VTALDHPARAGGPARPPLRTPIPGGPRESGHGNDGGPRPGSAGAAPATGPDGEPRPSSADAAPATGPDGGPRPSGAGAAPGPDAEHPIPAPGPNFRHTISTPSPDAKHTIPAPSADSGHTISARGPGGPDPAPPTARIRRGKPLFRATAPGGEGERGESR
jgi:arabinofuranan 3-O-arabinosyltransferase